MFIFRCFRLEMAYGNVDHTVWCLPWEPSYAATSMIMMFNQLSPMPIFVCFILLSFIYLCVPLWVQW